MPREGRRADGVHVALDEGPLDARADGLGGVALTLRRLLDAVGDLRDAVARLSVEDDAADDARGALAGLRRSSRGRPTGSSRGRARMASREAEKARSTSSRFGHRSGLRAPTRDSASSRRPSMTASTMGRVSGASVSRGCAEGRHGRRRRERWRAPGRAGSRRPSRPQSASSRPRRHGPPSVNNSNVNYLRGAVWSPAPASAA